MQIPKLVIAIPCYNEELCIEPTCNRLFEVMDMLIEKNKISSESYIYLVDDGSSDTTWAIIEKLHHENPARVKAQKFVKNYGNQKALIAGLEGARRNGCDCVISIDADLQQDELSIENFVDEYVKGFDVVLGVRNDRKTDTFFKKVTAQMFYKLMNILGAKIPPNHSDYRLVSKKALDVMNMYPEKALFLRGFFHEVGLNTTIVHFNVKPRFAGKSKFNFMSLMGLALNGITSFSIVPLRIIACLGFIMFVTSFCMGLETIYEKIFFNDSPNGYATAIILLCFFGGLQIFCLGVIGEYLGQVYREVKARPRYITEKELV
jgi:glycosyltransferase involved in cell wall biosynthesis